MRFRDSFRRLRFGSLRFGSLLGFTTMLAGLLLSPAVPARSQVTTTGSVSGQVTDQQNAAIPGAEVKLFEALTNSTQSTVTNEAGRYIFVSVPSGIYDITVTKDGFTAFKVSRQQVSVGIAVTINAALSIGATTTTVEATAAAGSELQTMNATVGQTITGQQLASPDSRPRREFVLHAAAGVLPTGQVAGAVADQNMYQLDGGNNSSDMDGNNAVYTNASGNTAGGAGGTPSGVIPTPIESIEEFKVSVNNQTSDFNGASGAQVPMGTKRGTNQCHGALHEYILLEPWAARAGRTITRSSTAASSRFRSATRTVSAVPSVANLSPSPWPEEKRSSSSITKGVAIRRSPLRPWCRPRCARGRHPGTGFSGTYQAYNLNPTPVT